MKIEIILGGLNCAHCAGIIEEKINALDGIETASLNFVNKKLIAKFNQVDDLDKKIEEIISIINITEPGLDIKVIKDDEINNNDFKGECSLKSECSCSDENVNSKLKNEHKIKMVYIIIAIFMYVLGFVSEFIIKNNILSAVIFIATYIFIGKEVLVDAFKNVFRGKLLDENFLMAIATIGAIIIGEYPEAVGVMLFYSIGELLESRAVSKSRKNIETLMDIKPDIANLLVNGDVVQVRPENVKIGDYIVVRVGEKVPLDGKIIKGESLFDTSAITGESLLREISTGDSILSGVINKKSVVTIEVEKLMKDSTVSKILDMVENASSKKSKTENFISVFAKYYTPIVVFFALILAILPPIILSEPFGKWAYRGLVFLVVSCPCALVLSIPLTYFSGIGISSKNGILVKGSNYLEALKYVNTVVMDKTGTITKGTFKVSNIVLSDNVKNDEELMKYAFISESRSTHPIANSIIKYAKEKYNFDSIVDEEKINEYEEISSNGIRIVYDNQEILAGNYRLMKSYSINYKENDNSSTKVHLAVDKKYLGCIEISDELKDGISSTIDDLRKIGIDNIVMLTGDSKIVADEVSKKVGITEYHADLLPIDKVEILEKIIKKNDEKFKVAFIGDGINDAPVIARSDVGISMGGMGSDAAIEASDIVFMTDEISKMTIALKIARFTGKIVWQNIIMAIGIKVLVLVLSAFGLANMWVAIFADVGVAVLAVLNSLRVLNNRY